MPNSSDQLSISKDDARAARDSQFGILDLILFTTGFAIAFGVHGLNESMQRLPILSTIYILHAGVALGAFFVLMRRFLGNASDYLQKPGCVILLQSGVVGCLFAITQVIQYWMFGDQDIVIEQPLSAPALGYFISASILRLGAVVVLWIAIFWVAFRWRVCLALLLLTNIVQMCRYLSLVVSTEIFFHPVLMFGDTATSALMFISCVVCLILDRRRQVAFGWLHWVGVTLFLLGTGVWPILAFVLTRFFTIEQLYGV